MQIFPTKSNGIILELFILRPQNFERIQRNLKRKFKAQPASEYERIVKSINFILFNAGRNLNDIYEKFFKEEYDSFYDYLEQEVGLAEALIEEIRSHTIPNESLWEVRISDFEGYNFSNLFDVSRWEDDTIIKILNDALKESGNEN